MEHARSGAARPTELLDLPVVPPRDAGVVSSFGAGVGGLILIVSSFVGGCTSCYSRFRPLRYQSWGLVSGCPALAGSTLASSRASSVPGCWRPACYLVETVAE